MLIYTSQKGTEDWHGYVNSLTDFEYAKLHMFRHYFVISQIRSKLDMVSDIKESIGHVLKGRLKGNNWRLWMDRLPL